MRDTSYIRQGKMILRELGLGVAIAALLSLLLWPFIPKGGGKAIPTVRPNEALRVAHPDGFSIVAPPRWTHKRYAVDEVFAHAEPAPSIRLNQSGVSRYSTLLGVIKLKADPRPLLGAVTETKLQGEFAYERTSVKPGDGFEASPRFDCDLCFQRGETWFVIQLIVFAELKTVPKELRSYFDTFQTHEDSRPVPVQNGAMSPEN